MHLIALLFALLFAPLSDKPDCRQIEAITGGVELTWLDDGAGYGYWDLPSDLKRTSRIDFAEGGIWEYAAESEPGVKYLWWFGDYVADGEPLGYHHFCAVRVVTGG